MSTPLEDLLCDLYAYVDDVRSMFTGEHLDEDRPLVIERREDTPEEDDLKERILAALEEERRDSR